MSAELPGRAHPAPVDRHRETFLLALTAVEAVDRAGVVENERDINKIIPALLLDKNLLKDNESMNRLLANENGVKKDIRYKLLQLENPF